MAEQATMVATPKEERLLSLDVIRGIALCGIAFVNVVQLWRVWPADHINSPAWTWLNLLFQQRFFPVFSFLFGIGFAMIVRSARRKGLSEWKVLLRRLIPLFALGLLHSLIHPGEALTPYAVLGLVFLWPLTFVQVRKRRTIAATLGAILTAAGAYFGGIPLIPGMFLLGFAAAEWSVPQHLDVNPKKAGIASLIFVPLSLISGYLQYLDRGNAGFSPTSSIAGLCFAVTWVSMVLVLLRTPLRGALATIFAPLGRMALTNYIGATIVILTARPIIGFPEKQPDAADKVFYQAWIVVAVMLLVQSLLSTLWLNKFGQGPLEKGWRWLTWGVARRDHNELQPSSPSAVEQRSQTILQTEGSGQHCPPHSSVRKSRAQNLGRR